MDTEASEKGNVTNSNTACGLHYYDSQQKGRVTVLKWSELFLNLSVTLFHIYRVTLVVEYLGWVDLDEECFHLSALTIDSCRSGISAEGTPHI